MELLANRPRKMTYHSIAVYPEAKQADISTSWLEQFAMGRIKKPPVDKIQVLYEILTGKPLALD